MRENALDEPLRETPAAFGLKHVDVREAGESGAVGDHSREGDLGVVRRAEYGEAERVPHRALEGLARHLLRPVRTVRDVVVRGGEVEVLRVGGDAIAWKIPHRMRNMSLETGRKVQLSGACFELVFRIRNATPVSDGMFGESRLPRA